MEDTVLSFVAMASLVLAPVGRVLRLSRVGRVPAATLAVLWARRTPIGVLCRVKSSMEEWGLKVEFDEVLDAYERRLGEGGRAYAASEEDLRQSVMKARTSASRTGP